MTTPTTATIAADAGAFEPFRARAAEAFAASIGDHVARISWGREQLVSWQTDRLRELLGVAQARSPYHAERLDGIDPASVGLDDLVRLPVMEKASMMERFDEVVTDRRLHRVDLEALVEATGEDPIPANGEHLVLTSGGSSGTRGIFVMDPPTLADFVASTMRCAIAESLAQGGPPPEGLDAALIAAGSPIHATAVGSRILEGGPVRTARIPATLPFEEIVSRVRQLDPAMVMGYPSILDRLAAEQDAGRLQLRLRALTTSAENLLPEVRSRLEAAFGVPVADLHGSSEGLIGVSRPGEEAIVFASDACIVEPVDEHDQPIGVGETSASVLVTNLYNHVQPLIRYRIEDRFTVEPPSAQDGHFRAVVEGRRSDLLRWGDVTVHPLAVVDELVHTPAIVDHVVRQTPVGVEIQIVTTGPVDLDATAGRIRRDLAAAGLPGAEVTIDTIPEVPRNPSTGKVARIVPLAP